MAAGCACTGGILLTGARAAVGLAPIAVVGAALVPLVIRQNDGRASFISTASGSLPYRLGQLVKQDILGDGQPLEGAPARDRARARGTRARAACDPGRAPGADGALMLLVIGAGGVVLAFVVAAALTDYFDTRNLLATWPALALVVAVGFGGARAGRWGAIGPREPRAPEPRMHRQRHSRSATSSATTGAARCRRSAPPTTPRAIVAGFGSAVTLTPYLHGVAGYPPPGTPVREVDMIWVGRRPAYGSPLAPVAPVALAGFQRQEIRTGSYIVVRYRAPTASRCRLRRCAGCTRSPHGHRHTCSR